MTNQYQTRAIVLERPESVTLTDLELTPMTPIDVLVDMEWSGISTGTEKLLWTGKMPNFPGMGYPLVPGYESVGRVVQAGADSNMKVGQRVFVPGAKCYGEIKGLFGGAASRVVVDSQRIIAIEDKLGEEAILSLQAQVKSSQI
jgi:3-hydroxyethyl bacteriochlorophyllide a dehydrogenase